VFLPVFMENGLARNKHNDGSLESFESVQVGSVSGVFGMARCRPTLHSAARRSNIFPICSPLQT
jgi:hypothetical protein